MCLLEKVSYWGELHEENYGLLEKDTGCVARNRIRRTRESEKEDEKKHYNHQSAVQREDTMNNQITYKYLK